MQVSRIACLIIFGGGQFVAPAFPQVTQAPPAVLSVQDVHFDSTISDIRVVVKNTGQKRITAFALLVSSQQMTEDYFSSIGQDAKLTIPRPAGLGGILPDESVEFLFPSQPDQALTAEVTAVVFDDRTAIGDETQITQIFRKRLAYASEWQRWAPSLQAETFKNTNADGLDSARNQLVARLRLADTNGTGTETATVEAAAVTRTGEIGARRELLSLLKQVNMTNRAVIFEHIQERAESQRKHSLREGGIVK